MSTFVSVFPSLAGMASENLTVMELRVISDLLQEQRTANQQNQTLAQLRNDAASDLGLVPATVPPGN